MEKLDFAKLIIAEKSQGKAPSTEGSCRAQISKTLRCITVKLLVLSDYQNVGF